MIGDHLDQTCVILLQSVGQDAAGGVVREPYTVGQADVPCLLRERGGAPVRKDGKATSLNHHRIYFDPADLTVTLTIQHRLQIAAGSTTRVFVVESTTNYNSLDRLLAVDCSEQPV